MIAENRDNGQLDWSHFFVVEEGNDVTIPLSNRRLDSTRRPSATQDIWEFSGCTCNKLEIAEESGRAGGNAKIALQA